MFETHRSVTVAPPSWHSASVFFSILTVGCSSSSVTVASSNGVGVAIAVFVPFSIDVGVGDGVAEGVTDGVYTGVVECIGVAVTVGEGSGVAGVGVRAGDCVGV
jgi:hypothetical protein